MIALLVLGALLVAVFGVFWCVWSLTLAQLEVALGCTCSRHWVDSRCPVHGAGN